MTDLIPNIVKSYTIKEEVLNGSCLAYSRWHTVYIRQYYLYVITLLRKALVHTSKSVNIIVGGYEVNFRNRNKTHRIDIQHEHTLVKPGGRDSDLAVMGHVPIEGSGDFYLVRIQNYDYLRKLSIIIEYSMPNMVNMAGIPMFQSYLSKTVYIAPMLYHIDFAGRRRSNEIISLFFDTTQSRRRKFLTDAQRCSLPLSNKRRIFGLNSLRRLYRNTKILVNIHQTDHHHTLEELRVLPALLCGVVIVSEEVPLKASIPYSKYIIWSQYDDIIDTLRSVHDNYSSHQERIFSDPELKGILQRMARDNVEVANRAVHALLEK